MRPRVGGGHATLSVITTRSKIRDNISWSIDDEEDDV
jgi:hypothetical protein